MSRRMARKSRSLMGWAQRHVRHIDRRNDVVLVIDMKGTGTVLSWPAT